MADDVRGGLIRFGTLRPVDGSGARTRWPLQFWRRERGTSDRGQRFKRFSFRRASATVYGKLGTLEVRLAATRHDLRRAQRLRYKVFYVEMSATPSLSAQVRRRDEDRFDTVCDHLLVVDTATDAARDRAAHRPNRRVWPLLRRNRPRVVGTYRVLRQDMLPAGETFYTQGEYDIAPLLERRAHYRFMELGRSCVLKPYRNKRTVELLWHGLWTYIREHRIDVMMGCASFEGTDPAVHARALSFLYHHRLAPPEWRVRAHPDQHVAMDRLDKDSVDPRAALKDLPPLIKGYLRLGAVFGDGAVVDRQFGTTDVFVILPVENIDPRYFEHFGAPDERESRLAKAR